MSVSLVSVLKDAAKPASGHKKVLLILELSGCGNCVQTLAAVKEWKAGQELSPTQKKERDEVKVVVVNRTRFGKTLQELKTIPDTAAAVQLQGLFENATAFPVLLSIRDKVNVGLDPKLVFRTSLGAMGVDGFDSFLGGRHGPYINIRSLFNSLGGKGSGRGVTRLSRSVSRGRQSPRQSPRRSPRLASRGRRSGLRSRSASRRRH